MRHSLKKIMGNNILVKIISFIFGYCLWTMLSYATVNTIECTVPLCFFNQHKNYELQAPETVTIQLRGTRKAIRALNHDALAIHINALNMHIGTNPIVLESESLFLPNTIKLVHYSPANIVVQMHEKKPV